jgi:hypothetical protein
MKIIKNEAGEQMTMQEIFKRAIYAQGSTIQIFSRIVTHRCHTAYILAHPYDDRMPDELAVADQAYQYTPCYEHPSSSTNLKCL